MLTKKEYNACKNGEQAVKVGTTTSKNSRNRPITTYHFGKYKFTKAQAKKISHALEKLVERDEAFSHV